jgi:hypothetical protein
MKNRRTLGIGIGFGLAVAAAVIVTAFAAPASQDEPADDLRALYTRQLQLSEQVLESMAADPERAELHELVAAINRVRDCRLRLADTRAQKLEACAWAVRRLEAHAAHAQAMADAGRSMPWQALHGELALNEAKIVLARLRSES